MWDTIPDYISYVFATYRWSSLLELLIIGFIVYSVMRFLRGTGGEKLFKGIVFLLLGFWGISLLTQKPVLELDRAYAAG